MRILKVILGGLVLFALVFLLQSLMDSRKSLEQTQKQQERLRRLIFVQQEDQKNYRQLLLKNEKTSKIDLISIKICDYYAQQGVFRKYSIIRSIVKDSFEYGPKFNIGYGGDDNALNLLKVFRVESNFNRLCKGSAGEVGLGQLMTGEWKRGYKRAVERKFHIKNDPFDAHANLIVTCIILEDWVKTYGVRTGFRYYNGKKSKPSYTRQQDDFKSMLKSQG